MRDRTTRRRLLRASVGAALAGIAGCVSTVGSGSSETANASTGSGSSAGTGTARSTTGQPAAPQETSAAPEGPKQGDSLPTDRDLTDGFPPDFETVPAERSIDTDGFETLSRSGFDIKAVPVDIAYYWYARGEARFADARSESEYDVSHVFGAVLSPAGDGRTRPDDPVLEWPKDARIVTYCDCPHHLSSLRAASLKNRGFQNVYAIDEGYSAWRDRNYPLAGADIGRVPKTWTITGNAGGDGAGETAWAYHTGSNQAEATLIGEDGRYTLDVKFVDVTAASEIRIETPAYELTASLGDLASDRVTSDGRLAAASGSTTPTSGTGGSTTTTTAGSETTSMFDLSWSR